MCVKMSFHDRLICFADFVGMTLLAVLFLLPLPNCFLRVCLPTLFADVLKLFLTLTTSAIVGTAVSNKSAPTHSAAGTIYLRQNGIAVLSITCVSPSKLSTKTSIERNLYLYWSNHPLTFFRSELNVGSFFEHPNKTSGTDRYKG